MKHQNAEPDALLLPLILPDSFTAMINEAVDALKLPDCCETEGEPCATRDFFGGRLRKFSVSCPAGHSFVLRVWSPVGEKWSDRRN